MLFDAESWEDYGKQYTCMDRARLAKSRFSIGNSGGREVSAEQELRDSYTISSHAGEFSFTRAISPDDGEVIYLVIADCSLEQVFHQIPEIQYEIPSTMWSLMSGCCWAPRTK